MKQVCMICKSPKVNLINYDLDKGMSLNDAVSKYGFVRSTIQYHRSNHMDGIMIVDPVTQIEARAPSLTQRTLSIYDRLEDELSQASTVAERVKVYASMTNSLRFLKEIYVAQIELTHTDLDNCREWIELRELIFHTLELYPDARDALRKALKEDTHVISE